MCGFAILIFVPCTIKWETRGIIVIIIIVIIIIIIIIIIIQPYWALHTFYGK